jgi:hypothetical protein
MASARDWAEAEFGSAELGDLRRRSRLVLLAADAATRPSGKVTTTCASSASREGAFRFLESAAVRSSAIADCVHTATMRRCAAHKLVFVAVDGTSLRITDPANEKGLGPIGRWGTTLRGCHVMSALAIDVEGRALGLVAQKMWVREKKSVRHRGAASGGYAAYGGESEAWVEVLSDASASFASTAPGTTPWFQMDRGADCWQVLTHAREAGLLVTIRATHDRRVDADIDRLWKTVECAPLLANRKLHVPARGRVWRRKRVGKRRRQKWLSVPRAAHVAKLEIRAASVPLIITTPEGPSTIAFNAVLVREVSPSAEPIEWLLLTTHTVRTRADVLEVVRGYTLRWRIEDFHRVWKRGLCNVEDTQLRSRNAIFKWATLLAAVATRAMRLTHLARSEPSLPASSEFTPVELEALVALRQPRNYDGHELTLVEAVRWIADIGGYIGPSNGPPGATIIGRGLHDVLIAARAFESRDKIR